MSLSFIPIETRWMLDLFLIKITVALIRSNYFDTYFLARASNTDQ